ncbi:MAG: hypothetical protein JNL57_08160 [Bacteroidetes bacterium]|nr:hypothetical protein [Bacteroidota bacterium]
MAVALYLRNPGDRDLIEWLTSNLTGFVTGMNSTQIASLGLSFGKPVSSLSAFVEREISVTVADEWFSHNAPVWLFVQPGCETETDAWLHQQAIPFSTDGQARKLPAGTGVDPLLQTGKAWVQDLGSQRCLHASWFAPGGAIWDCCCGAGGKSLQLRSMLPEGILYASDKRPGSIQNLKSRFAALKIELPVCGTLDLYHPQPTLCIGTAVFDKPVFDTIVADVPCTGSGTWRRNPENRHTFQSESIQEYTRLQRRIVAHALPFLKPGGRLIYLTCSLFRAENSENVEWLSQNHSLQVLEQGFSGGAALDADYIYYASLVKP